MLDIRPIADATFGVEIHGLDLRRDLGDETMREIVNALHDHRMLIIKEQDLDEESYLAFGREMGRPDAHPLDHLRMPGYPELEPIGNTNEKDRDERTRYGAAFWHTDQSYEADPASAIILYAVKVPRSGGETFIADMRTAYEDLDAEHKARIDDLVVQHDYQAARDSDGESKPMPIKTEAQAARLPPVRHYLAPAHPATTRRSLYAVTGFASGIEGMAPADAKALLGELKSHALQSRYIYERKHVVGDITVLDTLQTLHAGPRMEFATGEDDARLLWRIAVKGAPRICARWHPVEP